jgi:hypothetical protein
MPNTAETETELNIEALDYVPEYALISFWNNMRKETQKDCCNDLQQVREYRVYTGRQSIGFILADKYQKYWRQRKTP